MSSIPKEFRHLDCGVKLMGKKHLAELVGKRRKLNLSGESRISAREKKILENHFLQMFLLLLVLMAEKVSGD